MLTLLRVRRVAHLRRRPKLDGASCPLQRAGSWQPSFFSVGQRIRVEPRSDREDAAPHSAERPPRLPVHGDPNYESGGQEFESLRARQIYLANLIT
jgi:hypothetical protein